MSRLAPKACDDCGVAYTPLYRGHVHLCQVEYVAPEPPQPPPPRPVDYEEALRRHRQRSAQQCQRSAEQRALVALRKRHWRLKRACVRMGPCELARGLSSDHAEADNGRGVCGPGSLS